MSYLQPNKWHDQTDINLKKMQSVGYIRPLECSTIAQKAGQWMAEIEKSNWQAKKNNISYIALTMLCTPIPIFLHL